MVRLRLRWRVKNESSPMSKSNELAQVSRVLDQTERTFEPLTF